MLRQRERPAGLKDGAGCGPAVWHAGARTMIMAARIHRDMRMSTVLRMVGLGLLLACHAGVPAAQQPAADQIRVYEPGSIAPDAYTVVKRLWTGTWRSGFVLPTFADAAAAIAAMKQEAVLAGADAI